MAGMDEQQARASITGITEITGVMENRDSQALEIKITAVIFDMDGIIVDSEPLQVESFNETLRAYGVHISKEEFKKFVGRTQKDIYAEIVAQNNIPESVEDLIARKKVEYFKLVDSKLEPMFGVIELVEWLKGQHIKIAVASSSPLEDILTVLARIKLDRHFDEIVSAFDLPHGKPDPAVFLIAAHRLGKEPENCIVLEDTSIGVTAAKRAGMRCIAIPNYFTKGQDFSQADYLLEGMQDAKVVLEKILS